MDPAEEKRAVEKRLAELAGALERGGFSTAATSVMNDLLNRYSRPMIFDPRLPGPAAQGTGYVIPDLHAGPAVSASASGFVSPVGPYMHTFPIKDTLERRIEQLRRQGWRKMCAHWELKNIELIFERDGHDDKKLRYRIVRRSDNQGLLDKLTITGDLERDWEMLMIGLNDCLEALSSMPEQKGWDPYSIPR